MDVWIVCRGDIVWKLSRRCLSVFGSVSMEWTCLKKFHLPSLTPPLIVIFIIIYVCVWWEFDCVIFPPFIIMTDSHQVGI